MSNDLLDQWRTEEAQPFVGWDFAYLDGRMVEERPPWSYGARATARMGETGSVLDLGTAGGERMLSLRAAWPATVVVTEEYPPNLQLARARLEPLGVTVVDARLTDTDFLPLPDGAFGLVLNRHAAFNPAEVARVLAPGGTFLTQQVHGLWAHDLLAAFDATPQWPNATPAKYVPELTAAGLKIVDVQEWRGALTFTDVGAIVYYLKVVPWLVPGFAVDKHAAVLFAFQRRLEAGEPLTFTAWKYLIEARRNPLT